MPKLVEIIEQAPKSFNTILTVPGENGEIKIPFKCRYRSQTDLMQWLESVRSRGISNTEMVLEAAEGWDLEDEFNEANLAKLLDMFHCFPAFMGAYYKGLYGEREKN